jgi:hypothetical protein
MPTALLYNRAPFLSEPDEPVALSSLMERLATRVVKSLQVVVCDACIFLIRFMWLMFLDARRGLQAQDPQGGSDIVPQAGRRGEG